MSSQQIGARIECRVVYGDIINKTIVNNPTASTNQIKTVWHKLQPPVSSFIGRQKELTRMQKVLQPENEEASTSRYAVIIGVGGTGKTELARKYAEVNKSYYTNIVWVDSEIPAKISCTFAIVAEYKLEVIKDATNCPIEVIVSNVYEHLSEFKTLIIFDNAEGFQTIQPFLPPSIKGNIKNIHILFTSQIEEWDVMDEYYITPIHLNDLLPEEAKEFVKKSLKLNYVRDDDIDKLIQELSSFPLVLTQAVAYINQQKELKRKLTQDTYGIAEYLQEFRVQAKKLLDPVITSHHRYAKTVYQNLELMWDKVSKQKDGKNALDVISILAYVAPDDIDVDKFFGADQNVVLLLSKYSIIKLNEGVGSIHRLLQQVIRLRNRNDEIKLLRKTLSVLRTNDHARPLNHNKEVYRFDDSFHIHVMFAWSYAIEHNEFNQEIASHTYGFEKATPIHLFASKGNYEAIHVLLEKLKCKKSKEICNFKDNFGYTPLHLVVQKSRRLDILKLLVKHGSDVNAKDKYGQTPLYTAILWDDILDHIKFLIESGSDVNVKDIYGSTPLHEAASYNENLDLTKFLIVRGSDVNAKDEGGSTPLHKAATKNANSNVTKFLIENKADVNAKNKNGSTPLHQAYENKNLNVIKILIEKGADVNDKNNDGQTPHEYGSYVMRRDHEIKKMLQRCETL